MKNLNFNINSHDCLRIDTGVSFCFNLILPVTWVFLFLSFRKKKWIAQRILKVEILTSAV
uniref:Uncharacterized protein n=1 Tax=Populus trichocarpa TaxID=3694 RepID=A0A2K2B7X1_POPTR